MRISWRACALPVQGQARQGAAGRGALCRERTGAFCRHISTLLIVLQGSGGTCANNPESEWPGKLWLHRAYLLHSYARQQLG